jgi:crossover junction endodeoxyribonuclease RusA
MLTITLPWPDAALAPNRSKGLHWAKTSGKKAKAFEDAYFLTHQAVSQHKGEWFPLDGKGDIPVTLTFCAPDKRRRDSDNLLASLKSALDGVATALTIDDSRFSPITLSRGAAVKGGSVIVTIGREAMKEAA